MKKSDSQRKGRLRFAKVERKQKVAKVTYFIGMVFMFLAILILFSVRWVYATYGNITIDSIIFTMTAPIAGTNSKYIISYLLKALLPAVLTEVCIAILTSNLYKKNASIMIQTKKKSITVRLLPVAFLRRFMLLLSLVAIFASCIYTYYRCDLGTYIESKQTISSLYEDCYVNPATADIQFPQQKRNLIYIFVESFEKTLEDKENGGAKASNIIPNMTRIQKENVAISNETGAQGHVMYGGNWTMAGMLCQTAGIPLMINVNFYDYNKDAAFLPGAYSLGQVLQNNGYCNELITGCDGAFAGTNLYYQQHGGYEVLDPTVAKEMGYIPSDYNEHWGFEDLKLFDILKKEITKKYNSGKLFNITAATLDTHADDLYICDQCDSQYTDLHDRAYHCTDSQLSEFIDWFKQQPCYDNTTLVISGDHTSMATTYYNDCSDYDRTVFSVFVNAQIDTSKTYVRTYSTMDMYPSTLAALGVSIKGDRLGLGTNIFSSTPTLCEQIGVTEFNTMLSQNSEFYNNEIIKGAQILLSPEPETGTEAATEVETEATTDAATEASTGDGVEIKVVETYAEAGK